MFRARVDKSGIRMAALVSLYLYPGWAGEEQPRAAKTMDLL